MGACESPTGVVAGANGSCDGRAENGLGYGASSSTEVEGGDGVDLNELHFLILHFLKGGPCKQTAAVLEQV
jgi:hypothetical protein